MINTDYLGFNSYGQSLSVGGTGGNPAFVVSSTQLFDSVMPNLGVRAIDYRTGTPTSFVPLIEKVSKNGIMGETLATGAAEMFCQLAGQKSYRLHGVASGQGTQSVADLSKGTEPYNRLLKNVKDAYNIAKGQGKTFSMGAIGFTQGERDYYENTSFDVYKERLIKLQQDLKTDIAIITGQTTNVPFILGQVSSHNRDTDSMINPVVGLAQLDVAINNPNFTMASPMYMLDFISDNTHLDGNGYRKLSSYYGVAMKKLLLDNIKNFIFPIQHQLNTATVYIKFNVPATPLVLDTIQVTNPGAFGFSAKNATGGNISITNVELYSPDTVSIKCASVPSTISYAINGLSKKAGRTSGPRGCLRDSQGDSLLFHPNWQVHNWCPIFRITL